MIIGITAIGMGIYTSHSMYSCIYIHVPLEHGSVLRDFIDTFIIVAVTHGPDPWLMEDTPYLSLMGQPWDACCEYLENDRAITAVHSALSEHIVLS